MASSVASTDKSKAERKPKRGRKEVGAVRLTPEQKQHVISLLTEQPNLSDTEVSQATGVSRSRVYVMRSQIEAPAEEATEEYGRRLAKRLPMQQRVALWARLARGRVDPRLAFAQKAALQRVEELIGHVTAKEKRDAEANNSAPGPIFQFNVALVPSAAPVTPQVVVEQVVSANPQLVDSTDTDKSKT